MNILKFLELVEDDPTVSYEGSLNVEFTGFSFPGIPIDSVRFFVVMDHTWPKTDRVKYAQSKWTIDETVGFALRKGVKNFVLPSILRGAAFTVGKNCLYADDVHELIGRAGMAARRVAASRRHPLVGITGAAGKSTLKAMVAHAYQQCRTQDRILSPGVNHNIYVRAMGELARARDHDASIFELSGGTFDQFAQRNFAISPDVAVITNISEAHTQQLGGIEQVARQKSQIFNSPRAGAAAVINGDTLHAHLLLEKASSEGWNIVQFGESEEANYRLLQYDAPEQMVHATTPLGDLTFRVGAPGRHMAYNALATLAVLRGMGIEDVQPAIRSFGTFEALPGRGAANGVEISGGGSIQVIDESYNANPASMAAVIETLAGMRLQNGQQRKVAVLGDMLELGKTEKELHDQLFAPLKDSDIARIYLHGPLMRDVADRAAGDDRFLYVESRPELVNQLKSDLTAGDVVVFKSSHSVGLDKVIVALRNAWKKES